MEVVQKTLDTVQARFNHEVTTPVTVFRRGLSCRVLCVGLCLSVGYISVSTEFE
jgi:hypothetical protein